MSWRHGCSAFLILSLFVLPSIDAAEPRLDRSTDPLPPGAVARLGTFGLRVRERTTAVAISPDAKRIAARDVYGGPTWLWNAETGQEFYRLKPDAERYVFYYPPGPVFSPDGKYLAAACGREVCVWDVVTGRELRRFGGFDPLFTRDPLVLVAFSADSRQLVVAGSDGTLRRWDAISGKPIGVFRVFADRKPRLLYGKRPEENVEVAALSADGRVLAVVTVKWRALGSDAGPEAVEGTNRTVLVLDTVTGKQRGFWEVEERTGRRVVLSPDGKLLAVVSTRGIDFGVESVVDVYDTEINRKLYRPHSGQSFCALSLSPDNKVLVLVDGGNTMFVWDAANGKELRRFEVGVVNCWEAALSFSADGRALAVGSGNATRLWDIGTGKEIRRWPGHREAVTSVHFSPNGKELTTRGSTSRCRWETKGWTESAWKPVGEQGERSRMVVSPDGRYRAAPAEGKDSTNRVRVWETATGQELVHLASHPVEKRDGRISALAFSPNGRMLALAVVPTTKQYVDDELVGGAAVHVWELNTGLERRVFLGHREPVTALAFSPDGRFLVSGSEDTTALVWDVYTERKGQAVAVRPTARDLAAAWDDLAGVDAGRAFDAIRRLAAWKETAVPLLLRSLKPAAPVAAERLRRLLADLNSDDFDTRDQATRELTALPETVASALRRALKDKPSPEVKRRLEDVLAGMEGPVPGAEQLRRLRALEALELGDSPAARALLKALATGDSRARITQEAKAALERLARSPAMPP